jgi:rhodanese-related sulfurtransferase
MPSQVDIAALDRLLATGAQLVEVLPSAEFTREHLPAAVNLPLVDLNEATAAALDRGRAVVVYCWDAL